MHDTHLGRVDAENLVRDLSQCRFKALAVRMHADPDFQSAVRRHARGGLLVPGHHRNAPAGIDGGSMRGLLAIDRKTDTDQPSVRLLRALTITHRRDVDRGDGATHGLRIIAAVEMLVGDVVERHFLGADQVAQPDFAGLDPGLDGHGIQHDLQREADAGPRHAAIRQDRTFVGRHREGAAAIGRHAVGARQDARDLGGFETGGEGIGRVGAGIDGCLAVDAAQPAIAIGIDGDLVVVLPAIRARAQMLAPILDPADGQTFSIASQARQTSSGSRIPLWPNPPPMSGDTMRMRPCSMPRQSDRPLRTMCGIWAPV